VQAYEFLARQADPPFALQCHLLVLRIPLSTPRRLTAGSARVAAPEKLRAAALSSALSKGFGQVIIRASIRAAMRFMHAISRGG